MVGLKKLTINLASPRGNNVLDLTSLIQALGQLVQLETCILNLSGVEADWNVCVPMLGQALKVASGLKTVHLELGGILKNVHLDVATLRAQAFIKDKKCNEELHLNFSGIWLVQISALALLHCWSKESWQQLYPACGYFCTCSCSGSATAGVKKCGNNCIQLVDISVLGPDVAALSGLKRLHLEFMMCPQLVDISVLASTFAALTGLEELHLDLSSCYEPVDISALAPIFAALTGLEELHLDFSSCYELVDISALAPAVAALTGLETLHLDFESCKQLSDLSALAEVVAALTELEDLHLGFRFCEQLSDLSALAEAVATLRGLETLHLDFSYCIQLPAHLKKQFTSRSEFMVWALR